MGNKKNHGGKKKHRGKKMDTKDKKLEVLRGEEQEYAKVLERKGGPIMSVRLLTGKTVLGVVRGSMRKRVWMKANDIILVSKRNFQSDKVDIVHVYPIEHVNDLIQLGEIEEHFTISEGIGGSADIGDDIFAQTENDFSNEEEWEKKYNKLKNGWELYMEQGNIKKARDMKGRMEKLLKKKPKKEIVGGGNKISEAELDAI